MLTELLQGLGQPVAILGAALAALWAVYSYRKTRRAAAARWVRELYEQLYTEPALLTGRELLEYDYDRRLRFLFEIRVADRYIQLSDEQREDLRIVDRVLNFFEQLIYLEEEGHITERDRRVFFEYWFDVLADSTKPALHRYLARCGYEHLTRALRIHTEDYIVFYGTLMRSYDNLARLGAQNMVEYVSPCKVPGALVDLGDWPGAIHDSGAFVGELWKVRDYDLFRILDPFERYDPQQTATSHYERITMRLIHPEAIDAWVYYLKEPPENQVHTMITNGNWEDYVEQRDALTGTIRECTPEDAQALYQVVKDLQPLTQHTPYTYWVLCQYSSSRCFVAEREGTIVGLATSFLSDSEPPTLLIWQLGVIPDLRGTGLSDRLLDGLAEAGRRIGASKLEMSIERDNHSSRRAFQRLARRLGSELQEIGIAEIPGQLATSTNPEILYRIPSTGKP